MKVFAEKRKVKAISCVSDNCGIIYRIIYRLALDFSYTTAISVAYSYYMGLTYFPSLLRILISYIVSLFVIIVTPSYKNTISSFFLNVQLYIFLMPMCSLYGLSGRSIIFLTGISLIHVMQCIILSVNIRTKCIKKIYIENNQLILFGTLCGFVIMIIGLLFLQGGRPNWSAINLNNVYKIRAEAISLTTIMSYFVSWSTKIIIPFLLACSIHKKHWFLCTLLTGLQFLFYCIFAHKTYLFTPILVIAVYFCCKHNLLKWGFEKGLTLGVLFTTGLYLLNNKWIWPVNLLVRRVLYVPATLKFSFYEFFSRNPKVCFGDGVIGTVFHIDSPYSKTIPKVIAEYVGYPESSCNTGYWGDAYANAGWIGVVLLSVILAVYIKTLENCSTKLNKTIVIASCAYWIYSLNDGAFLTNLLTGGGLLFLLILVFSNLQKKHHPT